MQSPKNLKRRGRLAAVEMKVQVIGEALATLIKTLSQQDQDQSNNNLIKVPVLRPRDFLKKESKSPT